MSPISNSHPNSHPIVCRFMLHKRMFLNVTVQFTVEGLRPSIKLTCSFSSCPFLCALARAHKNGVVRTLGGWLVKGCTGECLWQYETTCKKFLRLQTYQFHHWMLLSLLSALLTPPEVLFCFPLLLLTTTWSWGAALSSWYQPPPWKTQWLLPALSPTTKNKSM